MVGQTRPVPDSDEALQPAEKKARVLENGDQDPGPMNKQEKKGSKRRKDKRKVLPDPCSPEDVLWRDVVSVLGKDVVDQALEDGTEWNSPYQYQEEVEVQGSRIASNGEALAVPVDPKRPWVISVPFVLPGETAVVRVFRSARLHSFADLVSIKVPNPELRDDNRVKCRYFGSCGGCQYQMLSYETQLDLKRDVVVKAYQNFSELPESSIPPILSTIASPLEYGYRTKITPHFDAPPKKAKAPATTGQVPDWLTIGFNRVNTRRVLDIEECPIATPVLNEALGPIRKTIRENIYNYKKGVSLLLRDSIVGPPSESADDLSSALAKHVCITDHKATVREKVGDKLFEYPGGSFFQNNNSVLVPLTEYVRDTIFPSSSSSSLLDRPTHLVDAYCGAGLFAIALSPYFNTIAGIELSADSIKFATRNAQLNNIPEGKCTFHSGDAANIFSVVQEFPRDKTVMVIDPPRKGCDENFIEQLLKFRCTTVVYVSCNVHTQARDVGMILRRSEQDASGGRYVLESLRGFDLFPQTAHVESVAVLRLS